MISRKVTRAFMRMQENKFNPTAVLDIGAFQGEFAVMSRRLWPDAHITMVEPLDRQKEALQNVALELGNTEYKQALLGEDERVVDFHYIDVDKYPNLNQTGSSKYKENTKYPFETTQMQQTTLDYLLKDDPHKYDLLKMDVQGAELDVLKGGYDTLKNVEAILMEVSLLNYNEGAPLLHDVLNTMFMLGFVLYDIADEMRIGHEDHLFQIDAIFLRTDSKYRPQPPFF